MRVHQHNYKCRSEHTRTHKAAIIYSMLSRGIIVPRIKVAQGLSEETAYLVEMALIETYGRENNGTGQLTNLTDGGEGPAGHISSKKGKPMSLEQRHKLSIAKKGKVGPRLGSSPSYDTRNKIRNKLTGVTFSDERKKSLSLLRPMTGDMNNYFGKRHSIDVRAKISSSLKGKPWSEKRRASLNDGSVIACRNTNRRAMAKPAIS